MEIKFWGVRGSIPCPGPHTVKYGGNTSCIELLFNDLKRIIIIDAGSGIRELGSYLMTHEFYQKPITAEIFLTHTHWDHIHGFPFFAPIYLQDTKCKIYGPATFDDSSLEDAMAWQLAYRYFPIRLEELASEIEYIELKEDRFDLGDGITLTTKFLNHSVLCLGYRFEYGGKALCTAYDTELHKNIFCAEPDNPLHNEAMAEEGKRAVREGNQQLQEFYKGADLLIHDAQYSQDEYKSSKTGWGHTSVEYAIAEGKKANVKRLALFHHEPTRTDEQIDAFTRKYCHPNNTGHTQVFFAREGTRVQI
jgi:phosphoribosyl 1,2-cyclic phosphodiesterase